MQLKRLIYLMFAFSVLTRAEIAAQEYSDSISVNFFLLDECRISQNISGEINYVYENFQDKRFTFICYFSNFSSKEEKIASFMEMYKIEIPYKTDYFKTKATKYEATVCPEVVVYDEINDQILYRGRIDNSYDKPGSRRRVVTSKDLREALIAIKSNNPIEKSTTQAIGCFINFGELN